MLQPKSTVEINGRRMAFQEAGRGPPLLLLHGNPTSSYLWRTVLPKLSSRGRVIAPDLIGMGDSEKLPDPGPQTYTFTTHAHYLDSFIEASIGADDHVVLVLHDWGSALGFHWANRNRARVRAIAYMEAIVRPFAGWHEWSPAAVEIFKALRSESGEGMIRDRNLFVERYFPDLFCGASRSMRCRNIADPSLEARTVGRP